jgi:hypothetical protein
VRKDANAFFQFRVRNLPYKKEVFELSIDEKKQQIVIRTTNKKYYKRFDIPDLTRLQVPLDPKSLKWVFKHATLIVSVDPIALISSTASPEKCSSAKSRSRRNFSNLTRKTRKRARSSATRRDRE